ncbi:MAG: hypothetical protein CR967_05485 [Proteobacteria bacterium]|nr:MAG: hypothetical protein CR967_05485 [Pseudomonadota bacterium]
MKNLILSLFVVAFLTACGGGSSGDKKEENISFTKLAYEIGYYSQNAGKEKFEVVRTGEELNRIYADFKQYDDFPKFSIDFNKELVLYLNLGMFNSMTHEMEIAKIVRENDKIKVFIGVIRVANGCPAGSAISEPKLFVKMSNENSQNIEFIKVEEIKKCDDKIISRALENFEEHYKGNILDKFTKKIDEKTYTFYKMKSQDGKPF